MKFKDLAIGDKFEVWGDHFLNYDYPKICKCVKRNKNTGQEIEDEDFTGGMGMSFCVSENDEVTKI